MDRLSKIISSVIFNLEKNEEHAMAKELLLAFLEVQKSVNDVPKYIIGMENMLNKEKSNITYERV